MWDVKPHLYECTQTALPPCKLPAGDLDRGPFCQYQAIQIKETIAFLSEIPTVISVLHCELRERDELLI